MSRITVEMLLRAYGNGIFPMSESRHDPNISWFDPDKRGILPLSAFHMPRRLARTVRQDRFSVTINQAFLEVIEGCASPRPGRWTTWINSTIIEMFASLRAIDHAHSVECWDGDELVGGLYGVSLGAAFFGESMFSTRDNASKVALAHLMARLHVGGFHLLDTQFVTAHLETFGAIEIPRDDYLQRLDLAVAKDADFYGLAAGTAGSAIVAALQSMTQTS
ncbi:MAG: leucyl/phenylalanyl-tRNA--protein transferase [Alphaproteobacteria bacterium]|jgi:leucyl/phenylalanyl-tRNA---protein transferase|nr:leucyl/phenylalanyl-tRNA--protein transferase [Alphaproteobacteria bacterium]MBT4710517.1 leucyl/phenylalanyl-tRNA--protein transferase [Alphaproteobacteria bacterium]